MKDVRDVRDAEVSGRGWSGSMGSYFQMCHAGKVLVWNINTGLQEVKIVYFIPLSY